MTKIIETKNLTKMYGKTTVVDKLDLAVTQGSVHGLLGPNGSGKSTTMKMLLGLLKPTAGEIYMMGRPMNRQTRVDVLAQVGSLIEQPSAYLHLTGAENLRIATRLLRAKPENVERAIRLVRLEKHMNKLVKDYSLGMKQRLGIALALLRDPQILILDEPTNGLDPAGIEEIRELIVSLARDEGRTVLVSSHLLSEIEKMATELSIIHQGQLLFQGTQRELFETKLPDVFVETTCGSQAASVLQALQPTLVPGGVMVPNLSEQDVSDLCVQLVGHNIPITQVVRQHRSLEEVFIGLTGREGLQ
ncbi:ABC transporter ATP-binding protein [Corynebacterium epidermidicanis]|uniref:ABC-type multidrug transport system, ATPase component n=1 Tax=Corynebacterium epidermidicanis TaxID=1050174 RepID=A0A0G3GLD2_9CORY|nr:ABC transporter ATP-binding protein [Corynebacterium epidermidicanis]AKK01969.1 ABC-type multidrug transport system, ATPase component [Corynebacterium epidermidicanis]